jgi:hypothetical protein
VTDITAFEQGQWRNLEQSSGKSQAQWLELANSQNFVKHSELVNWLKSEFGIGHGNGWKHQEALMRCAAIVSA